MATAAITPDQDTIVAEIFIADPTPLSFRAARSRQGRRERVEEPAF